MLTAVHDGDQQDLRQHGRVEAPAEPAAKPGEMPAAYLKKVKAWLVPLELVFRLPSTVAIHWDSGRPLGLRTLTMACWCAQSAMVTALKHARPSKYAVQSGAECWRGHSHWARNVKSGTGVSFTPNGCSSSVSETAPTTGTFFSDPHAVTNQLRFCMAATTIMKIYAAH